MTVELMKLSNEIEINHVLALYVTITETVFHCPDLNTVQTFVSGQSHR